MLRAAARSDTGRIREGNEDCCFADPERGIFIVADGMGGHAAGEVASGIALDRVRERLLEGLPAGKEPGGLLREAIREAGKAVFRKASEVAGFSGMGTTVVAVVISGDEIFVGHAGDSRAYMLGKEGLKALTEDHTKSTDLFRKGVLRREEIRRHHLSHVLTRAVGVMEDVEVDIASFPYGGETVLLCSDGLTDMLEDKEIESVLREASGAEEACVRLVALANEAGGVDNITAVVVAGKSE